MGKGQSKAYWQPDEDAPHCNLCGTAFSFATRRHHCRNCGFVVCSKCSTHRCPIMSRGIPEPVRVCDSCFFALMESMRSMPVPTVHGGRGFNPKAAESPKHYFPCAETNSAPGKNNNTRGNANHPPPLDGTRQEPTAPVDFTAQTSQKTLSPPSQQLQQQQGEATDPATTAAADASEERASATAEAEAEEPVNDAYQDAYGTTSASQQPSQRQQQQQPQAQSDNNTSPEQMEREILARQWATVRQEARFVDILVQRAEKVEPTSMVEYSRETEAVTLQPEVPPQVLGSTVLPLPPPVDNSAKYLMEPVKLWTRKNSKQLFTLEAVAASIGPKLQPAIAQEAIRRACPTHFAES